MTGHVGAVTALVGTSPHNTVAATAALSMENGAVHYQDGGAVSGGHDGLVKVWSPTLVLLATFNLATLASPAPLSPPIQSVDWDMGYHTLVRK